MRLLYLLFLAFTIFSCGNSRNQSTTQFFTANDSAFQYSGRHTQTSAATELINSGASVKVSVLGDSITIYFQSGNEHHQYVSLEINGEYRGRFKVQQDSLRLSLPEREVFNELVILKDTEASNGSIIFKGISAEKIRPVTKNQKYKIEFIGNSITCGMGADTRQIECGEGEWYNQHNAYLAYGPRVARALNAEFELSCVSGMGRYRNWNDEDQPVMPDVYANLRINGSQAEKANFEGKAPNIVSIALGTNDLSLGDGAKERKPFNPEKFTLNYISFVENIITYYPETKIALLSSPMIGEKENKILIDCLKKVQDHFTDSEIAIFEFEKMAPQGCNSHPNIKDHREMAKKLIPFFKDLLAKN